MGFTWKYHPITVRKGSYVYTPDFYIETNGHDNMRAYVEVKPSAEFFEYNKYYVIRTELDANLILVDGSPEVKEYLYASNRDLCEYTQPKEHDIDSWCSDCEFGHKWGLGYMMCISQEEKSWNKLGKDDDIYADVRLAIKKSFDFCKGLR